MPRKARKPVRPEWNGFVVCNLGKQDKEAAKKWVAAQQVDVWDVVAKLTDGGYKVSFSVDRYHDAALCSLSCTDTGHAHYGYTLTARAPEMQSAFLMLLYKHYVVLGESWSTREPSSDADSQWG